MGLSKTIWSSPAEYLRVNEPLESVLFFAPSALHASARRFLEGFPGMVTYAVKANPDEIVIENLAAAGVRGFDVASPAEIRLIARLAPGAAMHYNNPVRARHEIREAVLAGVCSWSVDSESELTKLIELVPADNSEIAVRFKLPVAGAVYDFGAKFGATEAKATDLLRRVAQAGFIPALTFHPGTQCTDPAAWESYIETAARISRAAGVTIARLNVGGGFPAHRLEGLAPALEPIFEAIDRATGVAFGSARPELVCEPGRAMVAESHALLARIKAIRDDDAVFLNDGVYGALAELPLIGTIDRLAVLAPGGHRRSATPRARIMFGPTCDSVDRLPGTLPVPANSEEGDFVLFQGMGAYSLVTGTSFNGFGGISMATVLSTTA